jgi:AcrR family transcriptional regulator
MSVPIKRPRPSPGPRWHRRKDARPAELLSAALEVFAEHGFAAARLEDVARRAGVTKGTIYLYFDDKEALFQAVVREAILPNIAQAERRVEAFSGSAGELLREYLQGWWRVIGESNLSAVPKMVISEAAHFPSLARFYYDEVVSRGHRLIASILERGIAAGEFRPMDLPSTVKLALAPLVIAVIHKHSLYSCVREAGSNFDPRRYVQTHIDIFLRGLAKPATPEA